jgi:hypothetical protein
LFCPGGKKQKKYDRAFSKPRGKVAKGAMIYFAGKHDRRALRR